MGVTSSMPFRKSAFRGLDPIFLVGLAETSRVAAEVLSPCPNRAQGALRSWLGRLPAASGVLSGNPRTVARIRADQETRVKKCRDFSWSGWTPHQK